MQARDQGAGGAVFEVLHRQAQQVAKHFGAQQRIDPIAGVQHQILPRPGEERVEQQKHHQGEGDDPERVEGLVDHDFINNDLGRQRHHQSDELDEHRADDHVAPQCFVFEQVRDEPLEAKLGRSQGVCGIILSPGCPGGRFGEEQDLAGELRAELIKA